MLNWDNHLVEWARRIEGLPFEWGVIDCLSTVRTAVMFIAGEDVLDIGD